MRRNPVWARHGWGRAARMHIDPNLIAVAGIALWLGGAFAFIGVARDWSDDRRTERDRLRRLSELDD